MSDFAKYGFVDPTQKKYGGVEEKLSFSLDLPNNKYVVIATVAGVVLIAAALGYAIYKQNKDDDKKN